MGMDPFYRLAERFPWLDTVVDIADPARLLPLGTPIRPVFADGGFDLQLGNPPWVRPEWDENVVLAERDPGSSLWTAYRSKTNGYANNTLSAGYLPTVLS